MNKFWLLVLGVILLVALSYAFTTPGGKFDPDREEPEESSERVGLDVQEESRVYQ